MISIPKNIIDISWSNGPKIRFNNNNPEFITMNEFLKNNEFLASITISYFEVDLHKNVDEIYKKENHKTSTYWDFDLTAGLKWKYIFSRSDEEYDIELSFDDPKIETYFKMSFM